MTYSTRTWRCHSIDFHVFSFIALLGLNIRSLLALHATILFVVSTFCIEAVCNALLRMLRSMTEVCYCCCCYSMTRLKIHDIGTLTLLRCSFWTAKNSMVACSNSLRINAANSKWERPVNSSSLRTVFNASCTVLLIIC